MNLIIKNYTHRFLIVFINLFSVVITLPFIANKLSINNFAEYSIALLIFQFSFLFTEWGFNIIGIERVIKDKNKIKKVFLEINASKVLILCIILVFLFIIFLTGQIKISKITILCLILLIISGCFNPLWYFQVTKKPQKLTSITLISRIFYIILIFLLLEKNNSPSLPILLQGLSIGIISVYGYYLISFKDKIKIKFSFSKIKQIFKFLSTGYKYFLTEITINNFFSVWSFIFIFFLPIKEIIIMNLCGQFLRAGLSVTNIIPEVIITTSLKNKNKKINSVNFIIPLILIFTVFLSLLLFSEIIIINFFKPEYHNIIFPIKIVSLIWFLISIIKIYGYPYLGYKYNFQIFNNFIIFKGLSHIFLIIVAVGFFRNSISILYLITLLTSVFILILISLILKKNNVHK